MREIPTIERDCSLGRYCPSHAESLKHALNNLALHAIYCVEGGPRGSSVQTNVIHRGLDDRGVLQALPAGVALARKFPACAVV